LSTAVSVSVDDDVIFVLDSVYMLYYVSDLHFLSQSCIPGMKPTWS
jgi:hypothetical protein